MTTKEDKKIKDAVALAKKRQQIDFSEESEKEKKAFLEAYRKEMGLDEEVVKKPSLNTFYKKVIKKPIIVCCDSDEEVEIASPSPAIVNQEPIINCGISMPEAIINETPIEIPKPLIIPVFELASHSPTIQKPIEPVIKSVLPNKILEMR